MCVCGRGGGGSVVLISRVGGWVEAAADAATAEPPPPRWSGATASVAAARGPLCSARVRAHAPVAPSPLPPQVEGGFGCALDLVKYIREKHGDYFSICVRWATESSPIGWVAARAGRRGCRRVDLAPTLSIPPPRPRVCPHPCSGYPEAHPDSIVEDAEQACEGRLPLAPDAGWQRADCCQLRRRPPSWRLRPASILPTLLAPRAQMKKNYWADIDYLKQKVRGWGGCAQGAGQGPMARPPTDQRPSACP